jgi:REP-associated tyrosine transposase
MPRFPRCQLPAEGVYHVTARGVAGLPIFVSDVDRHDFVDLLTSIASATAWECHVFCLMTTHYHLVVEALLERLSAGMHQLNGRYAMLFNRRHDRRGHLFESRFSAWVVRDEEHYEATCRYVLDNPARAGLDAPGRPWPWAAQLA